MLIASICAASDPVTIVLEPSRDNTVYSEADESNGKGSFLFSGRAQNGSRRRALLAFDVAQEIPAGATVETATLTLRMNKTIAGSANFSLHRLTHDWGEGNSNAPGEEGAGTAAQAGDATWRHAFFPDIMWSAQGADYQSSSSASTSVAGNGSYTWTSATLTADIQMWLDQPDTDFGWVLIGTESGTTAKRFDSREATTAANRPQLSITYIVEDAEPVPSFWADSPEVTTGWRYSGEAYDDITGIGWIYDPHFPWIFTFAHNDTNGAWIYVLTTEGNHAANFWGYHADLNYWFFADATDGWFYSFQTSNPGWKQISD